MGLLAAMGGFQLIMALAIFLVCALLMLVILIQKGRGGGLAAAFGGGGGGGAFGAKTGDVFTGITVALALVFLLLTVLGNYMFRQDATVANAAESRQTPPATTDSSATQPAAPGQSGNAGPVEMTPTDRKPAELPLPPPAGAQPAAPGGARPGDADGAKPVPPEAVPQAPPPAAPAPPPGDASPAKDPNSAGGSGTP